RTRPTIDTVTRTAASERADINGKLAPDETLRVRGFCLREMRCAPPPAAQHFRYLVLLPGFGIRSLRVSPCWSIRNRKASIGSVDVPVKSMNNARDKPSPRTPEAGHLNSSTPRGRWEGQPVLRVVPP